MNFRDSIRIFSEFFQDSLQQFPSIIDQFLKQFQASRDAEFYKDFFFQGFFSRIITSITMVAGKQKQNEPCTMLIW